MGNWLKNKWNMFYGIDQENKRNGMSIGDRMEYLISQGPHMDKPDVADAVLDMIAIWARELGVDYQNWPEV
jgi:hypothetical protein